MEDDITPSSEEFDNCFDCSDDTVVTNSDTEMVKLKTELSALKMFVAKQFYLLKQSVGKPKNPSCNCNNSSEIYIKSLHDQIHYLKEENQIKNNIIQSLVHHNPSYTVNNNLPTSSKFNNVSDHSYSNPGNDDPSNNQKDDDCNGGDNKVDDRIENLSEKDDENKHKNLEQKNITTRKKKKKKKEKTINNEERINSGNDKRTSPSKSKESVFIMGGSMVKKVNGFYITRNIKHKYLVKVRSFSSAKRRCMYDHVKPSIREYNPEHVILHVGTNDLNSEKTASQIASSIIELAVSLKNDANTIHVSLIVP